MHLRGVLLVLLTACGVDPTRADPDADASTCAADSSSTGTPDPAATSGGELTGAISDP